MDPRPRDAPAVDRLFVIAFATAWLAALAPIWWPRFLPLFDFPAHLVHIAIWHRLPDPSWHYQDFYRPSLHPVPYWGYWFPVHLLAYLVPLETANKLYLSLYAAALPASVAVLGRRLGRSPWIALFAFPLVYNFAFSYGFIGYSMSCALAHFTLACADRCLERASPGRLAGLLALALATYFTHFLPWLVMGLCFGALLVARRPPLSRSLPASLALLSTALLAAMSLGRVIDANLYGVAAGGMHLVARGERWQDALASIPRRLLQGWPGAGDELAVAVLLVAALVLLVSARRRGGPARGLADRLPAIWAGFALAGYLVIPFYLFAPIHWWNAGARLIVPAALYSILLVRGPIEGRTRLALVPVLAVCVLYPIELGRRFAAFDGRLAGLVRLLERVPRGSSTLTLCFGDPRDPALDPQSTPWRAVHSYPQLLAGGFDPYQYRNGFPFRPIPERILPAPSWPEPFEITKETINAYDFVLTRGERADGERVPARLIARDGAFRLYSTRGLDPPPR